MRLLSGLMKTGGMWLTILSIPGEKVILPHWCLGTGLVLMMLSWYVLDSYYRRLLKKAGIEEESWTKRPFPPGSRL